MMSPSIGLSPEQERIVSFEEGPIYVKASAGSGKTRVLTERIRYLLGKTKKRILALTFTNKAGEEIRQRLDDVSNLDRRLFVGTFHSFCQHALENHGSLLGFSKMPDIFEAETDRLELIEQAIQQTPSYHSTYREQSEREQRNARYQGLEFIAKVKRNLIADQGLCRHTDDEKLVLFYQTYQDLLRSQNAIDFDDLLLFTYNLFVNYPKIADLYRRSFQIICIDEAQDLNNAQYQLLLALTGGEHHNIMMVGDPHQSIFHFIGSSADFMDKRFVEDFKPTVFELTKNYRSSQKVFAAAKKLLSGSEVLDPSKEPTDIAKKGAFEICSLENEWDEAQWIVDRIKNLVELKHHDDIEGDICYEKIIVLARHKYVFNQLEPKLIGYGLPFYYKMTLGNIGFESYLMKLFDLAFRIKLNPQNVLHKIRLCEMLKIDKHEKSDLRTITTMLDESLDESMEKKILEIVIDLKDDGSDLKKQFETFKNQLVVDDDNDKKMILDDIEELLRHWHHYASKTDHKSIRQFKNAMALGQTQPLAQHHGITLSTIHSMKGQESDIVFLMGMDDETFPDYRAIRNNGIELIQEKNNLYVAFTRAKRFLYVTWPKKRHMPWGDEKNKKISRFLKVFNEEIY